MPKEEKVKKGVGKRGKDKKKRKINKPKISEQDVQYWNETIDVVEEFLCNYVNSDKMKEYLKEKEDSVGRPNSMTPAQVVERGIAYFRFVVKHQKYFTLHGLALFMGVDVTTIMRMGQLTESNSYVADAYVPIIKSLKNLIGLFHEEQGNAKINPNFNIFVLKAMRNGFEEQVDHNIHIPQGLDEKYREDLRQRVRGFSASFTAKEVIAEESKELTYGKNS